MPRERAGLGPRGSQMPMGFLLSLFPKTTLGTIKMMMIIIGDGE